MSYLTIKQEKKIIRLYQEGKYLNEVARILNVYPQVVRNCLKRNKIKIIQYKSPGSFGEQNPKWKGGIRHIKGVQHIYSPNHHLARKDGWVPEHRWIMEEVLKRKLKKNEVVHHKFGKINDPINLEVFKNNGTHRANHCKTQSRDENGRFK